ncbi:MAG: S-layer homology domain-containing protein [Lawsonibacter sp.]|nr:S-layer homology domain-containing protein [Lawsonibacter sp.]
MPTGASGQVGVYEESGIAGDVVFYPTHGAEAVYDFAVLSHSTLAANQNTSGRFALYPLNTVKLSKVNYNVSLSLYDEETGAAYTGDVVIRGGVYLNDVYQSATTINGTMGNADQTVSADGEGQYCLEFSPSDFTDSLTPSNSLKYVIEVRFRDNSHLTQYITVKNDEIQAGKASPLGVCLSEGIKKLDASSVQNRAVVLSQTLTINGTEKSMSDLLCLEKTPESATLDMTLMIQSDYGRYYQVLFLDSTNGRVGCAGNAEVTASYPFSDTVTLHSSVNLYAWLNDVIQNTLKPGEKTKLYPMIRSTDGSLEIKLAKPISIQNFFGIPKMDSILHSGGDGYEICDLLFGINAVNLPFSDDNEAVKSALEKLAGYGLSSASFGIEVKSTNNPLVYKGIIRYAAGSYSADNPSGVFVGSGETSSYNFMPGVSDVKAMSKGTFLKDAKKEMSNSHGRSVYGGGAYLQCEIYFSTKEQKWKVRLLEGDVYLGGGGVYRRSYNGWVSYVPVTATFQTSMTAELGFTILHHGDKTAYIPRLRPVFSIYGFGGCGRDYEVVSLKAGVYGLAQHDQLYLWYSDNAGNSANGQKLTIAGEVGVEYEIKLAFIELHGKYVLTDASKSWTYNNYNYINNKIVNGILSDFLGSSGRSADGGMLSLVPVEESVSFEDRSYLEDFDRSWGSSLPFMRLFSTAASDTITDFWTNAYPYANPSTSDDGVLMTYLSDMDSTEIADTAACFTVSDESGVFPEGKEISESDYPDSDLSLSGTSDDASAVWVRSFTNTDGKASGEATAADAVKALSAAEVMAGIYKDGTFTTTKLTDNDNPDLAPVTAASGDRAVAAWRSVTLGALDNPLDFTSDYIMYSVYNGSDWSAAKYLYDGSVDDVSVLKAAMLPDGTSAIVYQIAEVDGGDSEIVCAVLNEAGEVVQTLRLTDNATADENPQITTAEFPDGTRRFVVGWNAQTESGESVVHFAALSAEGALYPAFTLELSDSTGTSNYANFHFTKGAEKLEDLSVVWCQPEDTGNDGTYASVIYGTKFVQASDGTVTPSGKLKLLALDEGRTTENFDVRVDPATGKLHFVLLLSETNGSMTLATADYEYQNTLTVENPYFEYENVLPGLAMPVRFTVTNDGIAPITELNIALGDQTYHYVDESIAPGESKDFLVSYPVPDPITDPSYTVTAQFGSDGGTDAHTGVLKLALPDVGIYQISLTKETQRERGFHVLLQNNAYVDLQAGTHTVALEVWDTPDFDTASPLKTITISGDDLTLLNDSLLSVDVTLTAADLADILDEDGEIQDGGALVYFRVILTEDGETIEDADISNDMDYISIHSLIERNGAAISLASLSQTADGRTNVQVDAFNNSMNAISNGNLIVTLRDENGNALETKQTYNSADSSSLLSISGEESETASLLFDSAGYTADVTFARVSGESKRLSVLNLTGVPLDFDPDIYAYTVQTHDLNKSSITAVAENPASTISVTRNGVPVSVSGPIALSSGLNTFVITVLTGDTSVPYTVTIQNIRTDDTTVSEDDNTNSAGLTVNGATRIALSVRMSGGNSLLSLGSLAQDFFSGDDEAVLTIPAVAGADSYTLEASAAAFAGSFTGAALTVYTEFGSVRIPSGMLAGMTGLDGKTAGITIAAGDKMALPDDIRTIVGDRPLLSLTLTLDGLQTDWSNPNAPVTVDLPYTPSESELEDPESIVIWYIDGNGNTICIPNGHYDPVAGTVTFTTSHFSDYAVAFNPVSFSDVASSVWYHDAVAFIAARGITTGTGDGQFSPDTTLTRGQFITLLLRTYGIAPDDSSADNFSDAGNTYYTGYLAVAKRLGISDGVGENKFAPEQALTRQEMFTLLYNALKATNQLAAGDSSKTLFNFSDAGSISFYAKDAIAYLVKSGIVGGNDGQLLPRTTTTRSQMAQVLCNLLAK